VVELDGSGGLWVVEEEAVVVVEGGEE